MSSISKTKCILSICDISPSKMGSFEEFLINLTRKLTRGNIEHVIVFRDYPIDSVEKALTDAGATIEVIEPSRMSIINLLLFIKLSRRVRPTIVHFHFYPVYTIVNYLKYIFNIKIIYTDHMGGRKAKTNSKRILRRVYYHLNFLLYDMGIDKIVCVSNFVKSKYKNEYGINSNKLHVIYNGINTNKFDKKDVQSLKQKYGLENEYVISCVGLRRDKGPHYLIKAAPSILKERDNVKFLLIGEGDCKDYLGDLADDLEIKHKVIFCGRVTDLADVYNVSSIVAIPSIFEEAFCFVAAEAMATGTPVVSFDSGAIKEVLYDSNYIVPKDYDKLATKIIECLKSNVDCITLQNYVRNRFSLENNISEHFALYKQLI